MNEIKIYEHPKFGQLRIILIDGQPWFFGKDVAGSLGYQNPQKAVRDHVFPEDKTVNESFTVNGTAVLLINKSGLYSLILSSKLESAKEFRHWVTSEVLPSIGRYGCYMTPETAQNLLGNPDFLILLLRRFSEMQDENFLLLEENAELKEKCSYLNVILRSKSDLPMTVIAKDYGFSAQKMNALLNFLGVQYRMKSGYWVLYEKYQDYGYTKMHTYPSGKNQFRTCMCWTEKGRKFLYELLKENGYVPLCEQEDEDENPCFSD